MSSAPLKDQENLSNEPRPALWYPVGPQRGMGLSQCGNFPFSRAAAHPELSRRCLTARSRPHVEVGRAWWPCLRSSAGV